MNDIGHTDIIDWQHSLEERPDGCSQTIWRINVVSIPGFAQKRDSTSIAKPEKRMSSIQTLSEIIGMPNDRLKSLRLI